MKKLTLTINRDTILDRVAINAAYAGAKSTAEASFTRVATVAADRLILSSFFTEMTGEFLQTLQTFVARSDTKEGSLSIVLELSNSYDDSLTPSVASDVETLFVAGVLQRWFLLSCPERAGERAEEKERLFNRIIGKLCLRRRPTRYR